MTELAETSLKAFYELWQDPNWPHAKTRPVPGIFIVHRADIVSKDKLTGRKIREYCSNPVRAKIFPVLKEMIEKEWIKHVESKYGTPDDYNCSLWRDIIGKLCGTWISDGTEQIEEFKRIENTTSDSFPELWCYYLTSKGREHYESLGVMKSLVDELLRLQDSINKRLGHDLLIDKYLIIEGLLKPCTSREHFTNRIQTLNLLIDKMRIKGLGGAGRKTIEFLEEYLRKRKKNPRPIVQNLRDISTLSAGPPRHEGEGINRGVKAVLNRWGFSQTGTDYRKLWEAALEKYIEFLRNFLKNL